MANNYLDRIAGSLYLAGMGDALGAQTEQWTIAEIASAHGGLDMKEVRDAKVKMDEVLKTLNEEFGGIHTGRASATLVEKIQVTSYGQSMPLKAVATISVPEPTQIAITPWDKCQLTQIEAAIRESDLSVSPVNDGNAIRITFPPMTTERR